MAVLQGAVLPKGDLILVSGANGLVGSHVVNQFLRHGYKVRGTVRDAQRSAWLVDFFADKYAAAKGAFELVEVRDLTDVEALKKALQGTLAPSLTLFGGPGPGQPAGQSA